MKKEQSYVDARYESKKFTDELKTIINNMHENPKNWIAPTKTCFKRVLEGKDIVILNSSEYDQETPIQIFINQKEIENITEQQYRALLAEFNYLRDKYKKVKFYSKNDEMLEKKYYN